MARTNTNTGGGGGGTIIGGGAAPQVTVWDGATSITGYANYLFNNAVGKGQLVIGTALFWQQDNGLSPDDLWIGEGAGRVPATSTNGSNTGVGYLVGSNLTTGSNNTMLGQATGVQITTGDSNTFVGSSAGRFTNTGDNNTFIGEESGFINQNGDDNTFVGYQAGYNTNGGDGNAIFGFQAGISNTTGSNNVFIGNLAGYSNQTISGNVFIGNGAGQNSNPGGGGPSVYIGSGSGATAVSAQGNVFLGTNSGLNATGGINVLIGTGVGATLGTGSLNTIIGNSADVGTSAVTGAIALGYTANAVASNTMTIGGIQASNGFVDTIYMGSGAFDPNPIGQLVLSATSAASGSGASGTRLVISGGAKDGAGHSGYVSVPSRFMTNFGNGTAAATTITLADDGNTFPISAGTGVLDIINVLNWNAGVDITLIFSGAVTVSHNAGGAGSILLAGSVPLVAAADTVLGLKFDGNNWQETFRKVA